MSELSRRFTGEQITPETRASKARARRVSLLASAVVAAGKDGTSVLLDAYAAGTPENILRAAEREAQRRTS